MSLSVGQVSNVSFRAQGAESAQSQANYDEILSRRGAFDKGTEQAISNPKPKKKNTLLKVIAGTLIAAGIVVGSLYGLKAAFPNTFTKVDLSSLQGMKKFKGYFTNAVAVGAEFVQTKASWVATQATTGWDKLLKTLKIRKAA